MIWLRRCEDGRRGQAMVDFALIVPLFILVLVGLLDVGRAVYAYNTVNNAAREAGRLAIVDQYEDHIQAEGAGAASGLGIDADDVIVAFEEPNGAACAAIGSASVVRCTRRPRRSSATSSAPSRSPASPGCRSPSTAPPAPAHWGAEQ